MERHWHTNGILLSMLQRLQKTYGTLFCALIASLNEEDNISAEKSNIVLHTSLTSPLSKVETIVVSSLSHSTE